MSYFKTETLKFLKELPKNNNREWFHANKKRYDTYVKEPFRLFIEDLIEEMKKHINDLHIDSKQAIFRIHRDVRFSKDKSPYKTHISAIITNGGKKDKTTPGLYIQISGDDLRVYTGAYELDKDELYDIRGHICDHLEEFQQIISDKKFKETFEEVRGEKNKIIPKEFSEIAKKEPLVFNKNFYVFHSIPAKTILNKDLIKIVADTYLVAKPLGDFLYQGLHPN